MVDNKSTPGPEAMGVGRYRALGLMSGTSLDGIDAAVIDTDGAGVQGLGPWLTVPYDTHFRARLRACLGAEPAQAPVADVAAELTRHHAEAVYILLKKADITISDLDIIGFHGHTILHRPEEGRTIQIGDGAELAATLGVPVVDDFRSADMAAGGQGAPLAPLYHQALARDLAAPLAVLNIGGVANLTWIGEDEQVSAFDTGPGNALIDDWLERHTGKAMDRDGALARQGEVDRGILARLLDRDYFTRPPPKSLDRDDFSAAGLDGLSAADGAATLTALTAESVARARQWLPSAPRRWLVTGGGRHNPTLMAALRLVLGVAVEPVEAVGWRGDALEAEAFAYLAVRRKLGLPTSVPATTGVARPTCGGRLNFPA